MEIRDVCYFIMSQFKENWAQSPFTREGHLYFRVLLLVLVLVVALVSWHFELCDFMTALESTGHDLWAMCQNTRALVAPSSPSVVQSILPCYPYIASITRTSLSYFALNQASSGTYPNKKIWKLRSPHIPGSSLRTATTSATRQIWSLANTSSIVFQLSCCLWIWPRVRRKESSVASKYVLRKLIKLLRHLT